MTGSISTRRFLAVVLLGLLAQTTAASVARAEKIEAIEGKKYPISKANGPCLVMVSSFIATDEGGKTATGKIPAEAAAALVLELRRKGVPAYTYVMPGQQSTTDTQDTLGRTQRRKNLRRIDCVVVLAGNYPTIDHREAQDSLTWIKKFEPKCMPEAENKMIGQKTPGRPKPLSGAFLTINPLLSVGDAETHAKADPLLVRLNSGQRNTLAENKGKYTVVVASFGGKSKKLSTVSKVDGSLDTAAQDASHLAQMLRDYKKLEAYVWHDETHSIVSVGGFDSPNSPAAVRLQQQFGAKQTKTPGSRAVAAEAELAILARNGRQIQFFACESAPIPQGWDPRQIWAFDPEPQVMRVPHW